MLMSPTVRSGARILLISPLRSPITTVAVPVTFLRPSERHWRRCDCLASICSSAIARCVTVSKAKVGEGLVSIEYSSPTRPTTRR
jgi:hypothetical protein